MGDRPLLTRDRPGLSRYQGKPDPPFRRTGKEIRSFGGGMFVWPHGIHVDRDGNVWVTDARVASPDELKEFPGEDRKGSVVIKFSPEGQVLMTLGKPGVKGNPPDALTEPTDVATDPGNGEFTWPRAIQTSRTQILSGASRCSTETASS